MDAIQEARERAQKERTERLYAEVKNANRELFDQAVMIGSLVAQKTGSDKFAADVERMCVGLVQSALEAGAHDQWLSEFPPGPDTSLREGTSHGA